MSTQTTTRMSKHRRAKSTVNTEKEAIWLPLLESASKGKDLEERHLIVLGTTPELQQEFLEQINPPISPERLRYTRQRKQREIPRSNKYTLGYAYHDILDVDQDHVLARMNVHLLANSAAPFGTLLKPLLKPDTVRKSLVTILLDWSEPWKWARQLRQWIRVLRKVVAALDDETKIEMEENMSDRRQKKKSAEDAQKIITSGPGEWDEGLGIPVSVVCIRTEKVEDLERQHQWQDEHFDFLLQWLRTVLLKHGASLCYTATYDANDIRALLHSTLDIESTLKKHEVKHNVVDRDRVLVPPNWDSWSKIRILSETFEAEVISEKWSIEIEAPPDEVLDYYQPEPEDTAVHTLEAALPRRQIPGEEDEDKPQTQPPITLTAPSHQDFLSKQQATLAKLANQDEENSRQGMTRDKTGQLRREITESIGSFNINVNGIDVDAEEATRRLREREAERQVRRDGTPTRKAGLDAKEPDTAEMADFFSSLIKKSKTNRGGTGSGIASPRSDRARGSDQ